MLRLTLVSLALVAGLSAVAACDATAPDPAEVDLTALSQDPAALVGTWDLIYVTTSGESRTPITRYAAEAGAETWTFRADGTATRARAGSPDVTAPYTVGPYEYGNGTVSETPFLFFGESPGYTEFGLDGDVLYLDERPVDGELREYARR